MRQFHFSQQKYKKNQKQKAGNWIIYSGLDIIPDVFCYLWKMNVWVNAYVDDINNHIKELHSDDWIYQIRLRTIAETN